NHIKKLDDKAIKGILVGYNDALYKVYTLELKKCIWVRDIHVMENKFINWDITSSTVETEQTIIPIDIRQQIDKSNSGPNNVHDYQLDIENNTTLDEDNTPSNINFDGDEIDELAQDYSRNFISAANQSHKLEKSVSTRITSRNAVQNNDDPANPDELSLLVTLNNEPNSYKQASLSDDRQKWLDAMQAEIDELENRETWTITDLPKDKEPLKGRWVYKIKTDANNEVIEYKARWVVKGFNQRLGIDYLETFL
ncbi:hypothetical protein EPUL_006531, partial [Erysiphe pulchra]